MSQFKNSRDISSVSGSSYSVGTRLKFDTNAGLYAEMGTLGPPLVAVIAGADEKSYATATRRCFAAGDPTTIRLHGGGTSKAIANGAIDAGAEVFAAANGKIAATGTIPEGFAMEAATANNDIIEVMFR